jgi:hypothetical protein
LESYSNKRVVSSILGLEYFATQWDAKVISSEKMSLMNSLLRRYWVDMILLWLSSVKSCSQVICFSETLCVSFREYRLQISVQLELRTSRRLLGLVSKTPITLMLLFYNCIILNIGQRYYCFYIYIYVSYYIRIRSQSCIVFNYGVSNEIITQKIIVIGPYNL